MGDQGDFFEFLKKISKITLIPVFFAPTGAKIFCWKIFFKEKTSAAGENFLQNACLLAENAQKIAIFYEKMLNFLLKKGNFEQFWWDPLVKTTTKISVAKIFFWEKLFLCRKLRFLAKKCWILIKKWKILVIFSEKS